MVEKKYDIKELLQYINPSSLDYQEWINVGMALKEGGYSVEEWDTWSRTDTRYHNGECHSKWKTFHGCNTPVTIGTIVQMAKENGWSPPEHESYEIGWDDYIGENDDFVVVNTGWIEEKEIHEPGTDWNPVKELITYIETLFGTDEFVGYVTRSWSKPDDDKKYPDKGCWDRTARQLIQKLSKCKGDIGSVLGDYDPEVGAWIRFNPLDGKGCKNENVTEFRYTLVESDDTDIHKQNAILRELELPIAALVFSGKKSLHAIVKIEAASYEEYRKRVDYLYTICKKNGLNVDTQNKNPSRLSRMPGVMRNGKKQFLIDTNIGKESWEEWKEWIESINDDLPEPESLEKEWDNLPELAPPLIDGVLRMGHKMLIAGPSKAGKSFALIEMCIAIAEGRSWFGWQCKQGRILYVNLELDRASCLHRFKDVYETLGWQANHLKNIDIWNLRGKSVPMDKLAPKLIRRAAKKDYIAVIVDPIYKVITGDENSADQMAHFCNQFDKVCTELGCAVIYCHHHSKGAQGGKRSMDRASGSGVFARDPDALLDLIELEVTDNLIKNEINNAVCDTYIKWLNQYVPDYDEHISQDDMCSQAQMEKKAKELLTKEQYDALRPELSRTERLAKQRTAWRIEGTLREFPKFEPVNLWFQYPVHKVDRIGVLKDIAAETEKPAWKKNLSKKKAPEDAKKERRTSLENAFEACGFDGQVTIKGLAEYMGVTEKTVRNRLKEHGGFWIDEGNVGKK